MSELVIMPNRQQCQQERNDMNFKQAATAAALVTATALAGCTQESASAPKPPTNMKIQAKIKDNPQAQQRYELTVTLHDAPGSFKYINAYTDYSASNCSYLIAGAFAGAYDSPSTSKNIEMIQVSETVWKGIFYTDALLDEDYGYGKGVCHWKFDGAVVSFSANGKREDTRFQSILDAKELPTGKPKTFYFIKKFYPRHPDYDEKLAEKFPSVYNNFDGATHRSRFGPDVTDADLFTATLSIRKPL